MRRIQSCPQVDLGSWSPTQFATPSTPLELPRRAIVLEPPSAYAVRVLTNVLQEEVSNSETDWITVSEVARDTLRLCEEMRFKSIPGHNGLAKEMFAAWEKLNKEEGALSRVKGPLDVLVASVSQASGLQELRETALKAQKEARASLADFARLQETFRTFFSHLL